MAHPLRVNQPYTKMTIDPVFIPILIKWLREAEKYLREKRDNGE